MIAWRRLGLPLLLVALALLWFANLDARSLIRPDEGRYAEIAREMAASGDWITPRLNGLKYFEKPPLQYWITAGAYRVFGVDEWTARLWPALSGALTVLVVWFAGRRLTGPREGAAAALVAGTMLWPVANAHLNTLDGGLNFFLTAALAAMLVAVTREDRTAGRRWMWLAWAACAGAVLSKGLVGVVIPAGATVLYLLATRDWRLLARLHLASGLALLLLLAAPWFVAVSLANPEFPDFFFVREHLQRYLTPVHRRSEPWWYFLPLLMAGTLPWTGLAFEAVVGALRRPDTQARGAAGPDPGRTFQPRLFLACWAGFVVLFFSASNSKLPSYILPAFPALAWLMGERLCALPPARLRWYALPLLPLAAGAAFLALRLEHYATPRTPADLYHAYEPWILGAALCAAAGALACIHWAGRGRVWLAGLALGTGGLGAWQAAITGHDALSPSFSAARFAESVRPHLRDGCPLYSVMTYDQTLPFYIGRTVTLVAFEDEMAFGLSQEPDRGIPTLEAFAPRWRAEPCALAFMEPDALARLQAAGLPLQVIARDTRRVLVGHPSAGVRP